MCHLHDPHHVQKASQVMDTKEEASTQKGSSCFQSFPRSGWIIAMPWLACTTLFCIPWLDNLRCCFSKFWLDFYNFQPESLNQLSMLFLILSPKLQANFKSVDTFPSHLHYSTSFISQTPAETYLVLLSP